MGKREAIDPQQEGYAPQWAGANRPLSRRDLFAASVWQIPAAGSFLRDLRIADRPDRIFQGAKFDRVVPFADEGTVPLDKLIGQELDGRQFTDLSTLQKGREVTPTDSFYIRTRASNLLPAANNWSISVAGPDRATRTPVRDLIPLAKPQGLHLMECSGNSRGAHFGMIGVASWIGLSVKELLSHARWDPARIRVLVSGFDNYSAEPRSSIPGASWIYLLEDLYESGAFLAFDMNGKKLTPDHGAPVRLVVPGCYGCCCIKWVNDVRIVPDSVQATSQMREYASRTHQNGVPNLAREYEFPLIDAAAMPVRVERWIIRGGAAYAYLVAGIAWGRGNEEIRQLEIRFNAIEPYVPVGRIYPSSENSWRFWTHPWMPQRTGDYRLQLRIAIPKLRTRRLDTGFYTRHLVIDDAPTQSKP